MRQSHAWIKALALGASLAVAVGACGGGTATTAPTTAPASGGASPAASESQAAVNPCGTDPITLSVWGGYPELDPVYKAAGDAFTALHPNVSFNPPFSTDLRGFEQKLTTAIPSNTAGDVVVRTTNFLARFIDENLLLPLPDDLKTAITTTGYAPEVLADNTYADNMWGLPIFTGGTGIFYNTDMYAEAGITSAPASMDDLIANAYKLVKKDASGATSRSGWSLRLSGQGSGVAEKFWILLMQYGKTLIRETPAGSGKWVAEYNGPEGVKLFQMYVDMLRDGVTSLNIESDAAERGNQERRKCTRSHHRPGPDLIWRRSILITVDFVPRRRSRLPGKVSGWPPARQDLGADLDAFLVANPTYEASKAAS
jgi:multiple sugar transport system substrate-binding protein